MMIRDGHVARVRETINAYRFLLREPEGKGHLGRPSSEWEGNVKMDRGRTGWEVQTGFVWLGTEIRKCQILEKSAARMSKFRSFSREISV
jgi:hypothetical protein